MEEYIVYIKINNVGIVTEINSSAFLSDTSDWIELDRGDGDKFHHAQSAYLGKGLTDNDGLFNYKFVNKTLSLRSDSEKEPEREKLNAIKEITALKKKLAVTDYISAKLAEGAATREEYAEKLAERAEWRTRINELEIFIQ